MNLITSAAILWENQKFQEMLQFFVEHSFDFLQK